VQPVRQTKAIASNVFDFNRSILLTAHVGAYTVSIGRVRQMIKALSGDPRGLPAADWSLAG
jgi:hypothetical protein